MTADPTLAYESLPSVREMFRELTTPGAEPPVYLLRGRSGTGKSALLTAVRNRLRERGIGSCDDLSAHITAAHTTAAHITAAHTTDRAPDRRAHTPPVLLVDDAHTVTPDRLITLREMAESGCRAMVVTVQPRPHDPDLRALVEALARRGRVIDLRPLGASDIGPFARALGMMVPRAVARHIHERTAGIHSGVLAASTAACATRLGASFEAVDAAVTTWSRALLDDTEPELLDAFVVAATGVGLDPTELTEVLDTTEATALDLIDRARASALITDADLLLQAAVAPLRTRVGDRRYLAVLHRLLQSRLSAGLLRDHTALLLAEAGVRDIRLSDFLCAAADATPLDPPSPAGPLDPPGPLDPADPLDATTADAGRAVRYYRAATVAAAGWHPAPVAAIRWAEAAARLGDTDQALLLTEPILADPDRPAAELAAAVRVCAGVWTRRGLAPRAARLYAWLGPQRIGADWSLAATVCYLGGDTATAAALSAAAPRWAPTESATRANMIAAVLASSLGITRPATEPTAPERDTVLAAVADLVRTCRTDGTAAAWRFLPCTAISIATLLYLSMGEPHRAADALRAATPHAGRPMNGRTEHTTRDGHLLVLSAWTSMLAGDEPAAEQAVAALDFDALSVRDRFLAHGVRVGLARRGGDPIALAAAWRAAHPLLDEIDADLLTLLPIGELWLAGIRLREEGRVSALVGAAQTLLHQLGDPPAWANAFHWYAVHGAIMRERPDELLSPTRRLTAAAQSGDRHAAALADASRSWTVVLRGFDTPDGVTTAVRGLADIGLISDATHLADEAATTADSATATALHRLSRTVRTRSRPLPSSLRPAPTATSRQGRTPHGRPTPPPGGPTTPPPGGMVTPQSGGPTTPPPGSAVRSHTVDEAAPRTGGETLSEREREVAELVLLGLTYREIGARLYISAKTVEHHVARIRRRIGAGSRSELLSMLRAMGHGSLLV